MCSALARSGESGVRNQNSATVLQHRTFPSTTVVPYDYNGAEKLLSLSDTVIAVTANKFMTHVFVMMLVETSLLDCQLHELYAVCNT